MAAACTQRLLGCPERIAPARRSHYDKVCEVHARGGERRRIRQMRRRKPNHTFA